MRMFDLDKELNGFFAKHVRLGKVLRNELADSRDLCMGRLANGLTKLGHPLWKDYINQGGYIMHTLNQAPSNNYDIDVALIFEEADLPTNPLYARQRLRAGFLKTGGQFNEPPTARTNAVTVWYASGEHLDFAVFRRRLDTFGRMILEHASGEDWNPRDPEAVTRWFDDEVEARSPAPAPGVTVALQQLRRVVRFVKYLTRARTGWRLPGGMIITALVTETYRPHSTRDDVSLYRTLEALHARLAQSFRVAHPTEPTLLTAKQKRAEELSNLKALLDDLMPKLAVLHDPTCTRRQARNAWRQFFNHEFWNADNDTRSLLKTAAAAPAPVNFGSAPRVPLKDVGFG
jgi:hypothetical protein